jgi:hypothetical protein
VLRQVCDGYFGIGGRLSASAVATVNSVSRTENASETSGERNRFMRGSPSAHRSAHPEARIVLPLIRGINYYQHHMRDVRTDPLEAPPYLVTCMETDAAAGGGHNHVVAIETQDPDGGQTRWSTVQVIAALREGERFVVGDEQARASLERAVCPDCGTVSLKVPPGNFTVAPCDPA